LKRGIAGCTKLFSEAIEYLAAARMKAAAFSNQAPVGGSDTTCCKIKFAE
jgi:hypothetical protein